MSSKLLSLRDYCNFRHSLISSILNETKHHIALQIGQEGLDIFWMSCFLYGHESEPWSFLASTKQEFVVAMVLIYNTTTLFIKERYFQLCLISRWSQKMMLLKKFLDVFYEKLQFERYHVTHELTSTLQLPSGKIHYPPLNFLSLFSHLHPLLKPPARPIDHFYRCQARHLSTSWIISNYDTKLWW